MSQATASRAATARRGVGVPKARADAARNRERILHAAREAFVAHGAEASLDEIARSAGVGNATLYRHFPDRDVLVHGVMHFVTDRIVELGEQALRESAEPFEALACFVRGAAEERIGALCPMLSDRFDPDEPENLASRRRVEQLTQELLRRGQEAGQVRADIGVGDVMVALSQLTRPLPGVRCGQLDRFTARHLQLYLDGLRAPAPSRLPGHAATLEELRPDD
ncbi:TetR/AcrR family transcriptional regulator [Streptomyces sp. NRRL S-1868]|uniref:TetR/AcrR family transcriptional regulator n=1 Tax=Streptomyces sp. NRRL S-1868 TaxID=1463892 RepID=UPI0004CB7F51|nr:TetR/AcrR family transcriptional regulator [Streptomyces sp. NRRL S-1868]